MVLNPRSDIFGKYNIWWENFLNYHIPLHKSSSFQLWQTYVESLGYFKFFWDKQNEMMKIKFETEEDATAFILKWS